MSESKIRWPNLSAGGNAGFHCWFVLGRPRTRVAQFRPLLWLALCLCVVLAVACRRSAKSEVARLLSHAELAPLPASATNVAYYQWRGIFTHETFAKFELSRADLAAFISNSPSLKRLKPTIFDTNHHYLPFPSVPTPDISGDHEYFAVHPKSPSWFDMTVRGNGREYVVPWGPNMSVVIDEDRRTVWLNLGD